jgi:hypothetical protein
MSLNSSVPMPTASPSYSYHAKPWALILASLIAAAPCTILMLFGLFVRGPLMFTYLYFGLSALCFSAIIFLLHNVARVRSSRPQIVLTELAISAPRSQWSSKNVLFAYSDIESVEIVNTKNGRCLLIKEKRRFHGIQEMFMENAAAFEELWSALDFILSSGNMEAIPHAHRRVLCSICGCPLLLPDAEKNDGKCSVCVAKTPADFRMDGLRLVGIGIAIEIFCAFLTFGVWAAGGGIQIGALGMALGLIAIVVGLYGVATCKPVRIRF